MRNPRPSVVFVEQFYYPDGWGGAELPRDITTHLARRGYDVEVICGADQYAPLDGHAGPDPVAAGVVIRRIPSLFGGDIHHHRLLRQLWFYAGLLPRLLLRRPPGLFVSQTNPPLTVPLVAIAAWLLRRPYAVIAMDVYPDVIVAHGALRARGLITNLLSRLFQRAYRGARIVVALGPVMARRLVGKGVSPARIREISNWATGAEGIVRGSANRLRTEWGLDGCFVLVYSGNLGIGHEFDTLLRAVAAVRGNLPDLRLVVIGKGSRLEEVRRLVGDLALRDIVHFSAFVPSHRLPESLGLADLAIATLKPGFEGLIVPSKVLGYMARGIPVLYVGPRSDIDHLIEEHGCGFTVRTGDVTGVESVLLAAHADRVKLAVLGESGRRGYDAELARSHGLTHYEAVVASCLVAARVDVAL